MLPSEPTMLRGNFTRESHELRGYLSWSLDIVVQEKEEIGMSRGSGGRSFELVSNPLSGPKIRGTNRTSDRRRRIVKH
jgi:hypothetical protein